MAGATVPPRRRLRRRPRRRFLALPALLALLALLALAGFWPTPAGAAATPPPLWPGLSLPALPGSPTAPAPGGGSSGSGTSTPPPGNGPGTPGGSSSTALVVVPAPCRAPAGSPACAADPTSLAATWPALDGVAGVSLVWQADGRPAAAPAPAAASAGLAVARATCTASASPASTTCTWGWPAAVRLPSGGQLLNGTYQVTACSNDPSAPAGASRGAPCDATAGLAPATVAVGVAPAAPVGVSASGAAAVTLRWTPTRDPDLAGYQVTRDGMLFWSCRTTPAPGAPGCPADPTASDAPPAGRHTYGVAALAFGPSPSAPLLPSPPAPISFTVAPTGGDPSVGGDPSAGGGQSAGGGAIVLGPVPYVGPPVTLPLAGAPLTPATTAVPPSAPDGGFAPTLPYARRSAGAAGAAARPLAVSAEAPREAGPASSATLHRSAAVALALLILAIAAHLVYLRSELARREALWRALRDATRVVGPAGARPPPARAAAPAPAPALRRSRGATLEAVALWRPGAARHDPRHLRR